MICFIAEMQAFADHGAIVGEGAASGLCIRKIQQGEELIAAAMPFMAIWKKEPRRRKGIKNSDAAGSASGAVYA
mgnify:CR=1 FL=1